MFEEPGCPWCKRWHAEVGIAYPKTKEGQRAPLRQLALLQQKQANASLTTPVTVSPTFVLVDRGQEVGRIVGYPGPDFFWGLLGELLEKLDRRVPTKGAQTDEKYLIYASSREPHAT